MASNQQSFKKVLDSTALAATRFIRRPPIDPATPIQGRPRETSSNAYKNYQDKEGRRLQKALNSLTHGKNIFVYQNVRTKQVVYSLTRYLEKNNLLKQMVNHGKKTIPATLRKDLWAPYYSVHFVEPEVGLDVYNHLRQFALLRQLSPPEEMITVTKEFLESRRPADLRDQKEWDKQNMGRVGQIMKKKERAQALMDQKATSIADIAFLLGKHAGRILNGSPERFLAAYRTQRRRHRQKVAREKLAGAAEERAAEVVSLEEQLDVEIAADLNTPDDGSVKILWQDVYSPQYAKHWPGFVQHGQLRWTRNHVISQEQGNESDEVIADGAFEEAKAK
ncbi:hypothetical protein PENANT_c007G10531 [Penicillium antarcticum]|uniref:Large ribosomal subunit protein mL67 n=1 Tax=Penicillium antarcticum TaxID=416450 RepID=A0A1V6QBA0_9EURO|nr:uncharacterized protein N7508_003414 [Penicillium antarcticum]KAJ5312584.1 hypothetical protein N7508_003414 [Penicillium antarcticum]OQD86495.1 hypothetical protein PENANT_c007G10531 [Penicillium antarcticum]